MKSILIVLGIIVFFSLAVLSQELAQDDPLAEVASWDSDEGVAALSTTATKKQPVVANQDGEAPLIFNTPNPALRKKLTTVKPTIPTVAPKTPEPVKLVVPTPQTPTTSICANNTYVYVNVTRVVHKKVYVPYYIYYSPHQYITGQAATYLTSLIRRVRELKSRLRTFRFLLKHLFQKKVISQTLYTKTDQLVIRKILRIERAIKQRKLTVKSIKQQLERIYVIFKKLDYNIKFPVSCKAVLTKDCKGKYTKRTKLSKNGKKRIARYIKDRVFTKIIVTKTKGKITQLKKNKRTIEFIKKGSGFTKRVIKINPNLRKLILEKSYAALLKVKSIRARVKAFVAKMKNSKSARVRAACADKKKKRAMIRRWISKKFKRSLAKQCRILLKSEYVKNARKNQFKDIVKTTKRQSKVTRQLLRLPRHIIARESKKNLIKFASLKFQFRQNPKKVVKK
jgi:hypothetical protein